jgi:hypothetical protein
MMVDSRETIGGAPLDEGNETLTRDLDDVQRAALKAELDPGERILWAERAGAPPSPTVAKFPAFFAAVLCGLSGFALTVMYGIYGNPNLHPTQRAILLVMPPAAIGAMSLVGLSVSWFHHERRKWVRSRTFYALTDHRAIVGSDARFPGEVAIGFFTREMFDDTRCIEYGNGSGDVFFVKHDDVVWPEWGFLGISASRHVEGLVRQVLLGKGPIPAIDEAVGIDGP